MVVAAESWEINANVAYISINVVALDEVGTAHVPDPAIGGGWPYISVALDAQRDFSGHQRAAVI